jgi:hypothetical protein
MTTQRERFEAWFSRYHEEACEQYGGLDCTNPQGIAEDAWQEAERQMIERCAKVCADLSKLCKAIGADHDAADCLEASIRALGADDHAAE